MISRFHLSTLALLWSLLIPLIFGTPAPAPSASPYPEPALTCVDDSNPPPIRDCLAFIQVLRAIARRPGKNFKKRWGRAQYERPAARTAHLPKRFFMEEFDQQGPTPNFCMFYLDDRPRQGLPAYDDFKLLDVVEVGERLIGRCLINEGRGGFGFPGDFKTVSSKLMRYIPDANDGSSTMTGGNTTVLSTEVIGNQTFTMYEMTAPDDQPGGSHLDNTGNEQGWES